MPFVEDIEEFTARQDCEYVEILSSHVFANGAFARRDWTGKFVDFIDPPTDVIELATRKIHFLDAKLELLTREYRQTMGYIHKQLDIAMSGSGPLVHKGAISELSRRAAEIQRLREERKDLQKVLPEKCPTVLLEQRNETRENTQMLREEVSKLPQF